MLYIVCTNISSRLQYAAHFIFDKVLEQPFTLCEKVPEGVSPFLCYGTRSMHFVPSSGILEEKDIPSALPLVAARGSLPIIYNGAPDEGAFEFDIFAAVFFCLSRAEEYIIAQRDSHGRFQAHAGIFHAWHEQPYVDQWIRLFGKWLHERGLILELKKPDACWINTLDIDIAFAYKGRSSIHRWAATLKDVLKGNFDRLSERRQVLRGEMRDPFDTYELWLNGNAHARESLVFVLCAERKGYDIGLDPQHPEVSDLLCSLATKAEVGIHPSYASNERANLLTQEIAKLEHTTGQQVRSSRQHFLRMDLKRTYHNLDGAGVRRDFSMGYSDAVGFRAGTAYAFPFFDFGLNAALSIELQPLIAMDSALKAYMHLSPEGALERLMALWTTIRESGGSFVTVWHNHSLSGKFEWAGWEQLYPEFLSSLRDTR